MKLHLAGGDGFGWALDEDIAMFRAALPATVEITPLKAADAVYSPWWEGLVQLGEHALVGKRVLCGLDNSYFHWLTRPRFRGMAKVVGLWIPHTSQAAAEMSCMGLAHAVVPYAVRPEVFRPQARREARAASRRRLGIPDDAFLVGNFQRDSEGADLTTPKLQKGPDLLAAILRGAAPSIPNLHVLLAGPRRHWIRRELQAHGIPCTFAGEPRDDDDINVNIVSRERLAELYGLLDLYLLTSRWEGGPYALLEAAACGCPVLSTRVGLAPDLLDDVSLFDHPATGIAKLAAAVSDASLAASAQACRGRVLVRHTPQAITPAVAAALEAAREIAPYASPPDAAVILPAPARAGLIGRIDRVARRLVAGRRQPGAGLRVSIFREFVKPPYGGGNQFMMALRDAMLRLGVDVRNNEVGEDIDGYIFDSLWFDKKLLERLSRLVSPKVVHRIDGPIHVYRGKDKHIDDEIMAVNSQFATASVIQSDFTLRMLRQAGYDPITPVIIRNAPDPFIFNRDSRIPFSRNRKIRLVSTSWSNNPRKGADIYAWLDKNLDFDRYDYTFVGRVTAPLKNIRVLPPIASKDLANILRQNDIYITASQNDPCSNALIEALNCGLPAIHLRSGGHPELVRFGGLGFDEPAEIPDLLETLVSRYGLFQSCIRVDSIEEIARRYIECIRDA